MNSGEFIEFLKRNKLIKSGGETGDSEEDLESNQNPTPFRLIVDKKIPSYIIEENKEAIAVLEINPISKGHIIIIPKEAISESSKVSKGTLSLAKKVSENIKKKLKPKEVLISPSSVLGEIIINIIPVYSNESPNSARTQASPEELDKLKKEIEKKAPVKREKKPQINKIEESKIWFPKRIP